MSDELRKLPSVTTLLHETAKRQVFAGESESVRAKLVREALDDARRKVLAGAPCPGHEVLVEAVRDLRAAAENLNLRRVINATGITLHTNLGRAPLPRSVMESVTELACGYTNLEMDLATGQRGKRAAGAREMLKTICGAEDAAIVNNGAAAVFLLLAAVASGKEVIVSRGELVQIGGGFRVPDILAASGAKLVEVGTTNITTVADYEKALTPETGLLLKVHRSNFYIAGHTEEASLGELAKLAKKSGVPFAYDLGSGGFVRWLGHDPEQEPTVAEVMRAEVDLATFSGDKLIGGPQSGMIVGRADLVQKIAKHPLYRAMRVGRLTMLALQEVLKYYVNGDHRSLPTWSMIEMPQERMLERAQALQARLKGAGIAADVIIADGIVGGGAAPATDFPTRVTTLKLADSAGFLARLRRGTPAVVPRVDRDVVMFDLRTVQDDELEPLYAAVVAAWKE